jgi:ATP phosphoribosyltransferase regulatory subunit
MVELPAGVDFLTGRAARRRRRLEDRLLGILAREGFEEIVTPVIDLAGAAPEGEESVYRFPDVLTGQTLALRSDFTSQVARLSAARLARRPRTSRICYAGSVFRPVREHAGERRQVFQVGAEIMGRDGEDSTLEAVALALRLLEAARVGPFRMVVGHVGYVEELCRFFAVGEGVRGELLGILREKNLTRLGLLARAAGLPSAFTAAVGEAMYLMGGEEVLGRAAVLVGTPGAAEVTAELASLLAGLGRAAERIVFDLTESRGFEYYTGVMFQAVLPATGREVCRGGRYDNLLASYGTPTPAVGFALDLDLLLQAGTA